MAASKTRLLLAEDDDLLRLALQRALARAGYEVEVARDGAEALALHRQRPAGLIISDLLMPGKDGIELLTALRRETWPPAFVVITGGGRIPSETYLRIAKNFGAAGVLAKPFRPDELVAMVAEADAMCHGSVDPQELA